MRRFWSGVVVCLFVASCATAAQRPVGWLVLSQHMSSDGLWWRLEATGTKDECRSAVKAATTRSRIRMTAWYDVSPQQLEKQFGHAATPDKGTWLACWPEGTALDEPEA
jgi:hypothetical protein